MNQTRILIVDDSALMRRLISDVVARDPELEIVGLARDGRVALEKIPQVSPEIVILDMEMPEMDGREALKAIRLLHPSVKVIMCSTLTVRGAEETLDALANGAVDYVTKPGSSASAQEAMDRFADDLLPKIKVHGRRSHLLQQAVQSASRMTRRHAKSVPHVVCIGSSTGGPNALASVFGSMVSPYELPILIVQHMPPVFTAMLAQRLNRLKSGVTFEEATEGSPLKPGTAYIAPGGHHMEVRTWMGKPVIRLNDRPPENSCRPAVDVLLDSVAEVFGGRALAVILTGMGADGCRGCKRLSALGARVIAQDEETSVVWGMPGSVVRAGIADEVLPLSQIGMRIQQAGLRLRSPATRIFAA